MTPPPPTPGRTSDRASWAWLAVAATGAFSVAAAGSAGLASLGQPDEPAPQRRVAAVPATGPPIVPRPDLPPPPLQGRQPPQGGPERPVASTGDEASRVTTAAGEDDRPAGSAEQRRSPRSGSTDGDTGELREPRARAGAAPSRAREERSSRVESNGRGHDESDREGHRTGHGQGREESDGQGREESDGEGGKGKGGKGGKGKGGEND